MKLSQAKQVTVTQVIVFVSILKGFPTLFLFNH